MKKHKNKNKDKKAKDLRDEAGIGGKLPGRNVSEQSDIEQTRIENRREADLEDKTPAGDAGVEDSQDRERENESPGERNY
jgi:hypothetical protein